MLYLSYKMGRGLRLADKGSRSEAGLFLSLLVISIFTILAVIGLAVDIGFTYRARLTLQTAVDVAATQGTNQVLDSLLSDDEVLKNAENLARLNLTLNGYSPATVTSMDASIVPGRRGVRVIAESNQRTWIMRMIPNFQRELGLGARAEAQHRAISVVLVLDRSGSMTMCLENENDCGPTRWATRMGAAKVAAKEAVNSLQVGDQVGLISYAGDVRRDYPPVLPPPAQRGPGLSAPLTRQNMTAIKDSIRIFLDENSIDPPSLTPTGTTNIKGAIRAARNEMTSGLNSWGTGNDPNRGRVIIFLTDGAPNFDIPASENSYCDNNTEGQPWLTGSSMHPSDATQGLNPNGQNTGPMNYEHRYRHMNQALSEAVVAQRLGYTLNTVGIGVADDHIEAGHPTYQIRPATALRYVQDSLKNPYQSARSNRVKEIFLTHLANDQEKIRRPPPHLLPTNPIPPTPGPNDPAFWEFPCIVLPTDPNRNSSNWTRINSLQRRSDRQGRYIFANDRGQLVAAFQDMIRTARVRLVN